MSRASQGLALVGAVVVLICVLVHAAPGDPVDTIAGASGGMSKDLQAELRTQYGLDKPLVVQLGVYLGKVVTGDLGFSYFFDLPVYGLIAAVLIAWLICTTLRVLSSRKSNGLLSQRINVASLVGLAAPVLRTGIMRLVLFAAAPPRSPLWGMPFRRLNARMPLFSNPPHQKGFRMQFEPLRRRAAVATLACAAIAAVLPLQASAQAPKAGGTLIIGTSQVARHLNGAVQSGVATAMPSSQLFASPLRFDDKWNPQPYLAESWKLAEDGKSLTLNLRKNAVFHDGKPITSADVAFSIMAIKANHPFQTMLGPVEKVDTPDPHTAIIRMSEPHPAILLAMSPALCPILPKHIYGDGKELKSHPRNSADVVGSGPFKFVEFRSGQRIVLERFDKFFLPGKPYLERVIFNIIPDSSSLVLGLQRGDLQMVPFLTVSTDLARLKDDKSIVLTSRGYEGAGPLNWLAFNLEKKPMSDLKVRQAIAHSIDKSFITKALMRGFATPADGPIVASSPFAVTDLTRYPLDLKKAAALLDEAGYKANSDGERFKLTIDYLPGADDQQRNVAEYLRSQLKKVGITLEVRTSADFPSWAKRIASHDFDLTMDIVFNWGDPVIGVHRTYLSTNIRPIIWTNTQSYKNTKVDELLNTAGGILDPVKRKAYYATFQKIITDELPIVYINVSPYHTAASKTIGNVPTTIWGPMSPYDEVYLK
jgi:peptide/nickel transport system substrate-binding protein